MGGTTCDLLKWNSFSPPVPFLSYPVGVLIIKAVTTQSRSSEAPCQNAMSSKKGCFLFVCCCHFPPSLLYFLFFFAPCYISANFFDSVSFVESGISPGHASIYPLLDFYCWWNHIHRDKSHKPPVWEGAQADLGLSLSKCRSSNWSNQFSLHFQYDAWHWFVFTH